MKLCKCKDAKYDYMELEENICTYCGKSIYKKPEINNGRIE